MWVSELEKPSLAEAEAERSPFCCLSTTSDRRRTLGRTRRLPSTQHNTVALHTIRYDTIGEFNVDSKAEYSALSSTRSRKRN